MLIQKALSEIRELRYEEVDLVGGAFYCTEVTIYPTQSVVARYCHSIGCINVVATDDANTETIVD